MTQCCNEPVSDDNALFTRRTLAILLLILLVAAVLRFIYFGQSPPGLNQDEAVNAWNAYCLLKTGTDQHGVSWPVFYYRGLGSNGSTLQLYLLLPFQAIGGLNITTTRLPAAAGGVLTILLIYYVGTRLFNRKVGLVAAALLALNPWHIQQSRWGHEASVCPLLGLLIPALLIWANFPLRDNVSGRQEIFRAALAGAVAGIACYSYQAMRIFIPVFLLAIVLAMIPTFWQLVKTRRGLLCVAAFASTFTIIFGAMAWQYIFHPEGIASHNEFLLIPWGGVAWPSILKDIAIRYIGHFGIDFLFINGDYNPIQSPPNIGQFHWYMLPLMLAGLLVVLVRFRQSLSIRTLFVFMLTYPVGDILSPSFGLHALRSAPGLCSLILLGAVGAVAAVDWLYKRNRALARGLIIVFLIAGIFFNVRYLRYFYGDYNREPDIYQVFYVDLLKACEWLGPRLDNYNAVYCTTEEMGMPYIITLVGLSCEPDKWFREPRRFYNYDGLEWDRYFCYGKMIFMYQDVSVPDMEELRRQPSDKRILFIVRPGELGLTNPIYRITDPTGKDCLWLCEL